MASLKDLYEPEIIDSIVKNYTDEAVADAEPKDDPFANITVRELSLHPEQVRFSSLFWKPKLIPDLPIRVFENTDWDTEAQLHIPDVDPNWVWNKPILELFALAVYEKDTTLLHGLQGTGKSCLAEQWCALLKIPFWRMSCNRETREAHFTGSPAVEYNDEGQMFIKQEPTILTDSLKYGGMFCEDEAFRHNSALVVQSLREKNNRTVLLPDAPGRTADERKLKAPENWWYILTDNTTGSGDETGIFDAEVQDASSLDRIDAAIEVKYLPKPDERRILKKHCNLNDDIINGMLTVAKDVRTAFKNQTLMSTLSVRGLLAWAAKIELLGHIGKALEVSWYNKLGTDDKKVVDDIYHAVFARKINDK
jgi:cobaltochelatase CobS